MLSPVSLRNYYIIIYYGINLVTPLLLSNYSTVKERGHMFILLEVINVILQKKNINEFIHNEHLYFIIISKLINSLW